MKEKLVVVGNGMAGMRAVEELLKLAPDKYAITVFGAEPHPNYNRILLSPVLTGEKQFREILLNDDAWYAEHGITLHKGKTVVEIDRRRRLVKASDGTASTYDRLLLATGSNPFILPVPGKDLPGVIGFRDFADVETMLTAAKEYRHAVVIGGGLLGLEAANGLLKQGMKVTVIHLVDTLMERQLDRAAGRMLKKALEARGVHFRLEAKTQEIIGKQRVQGVRLVDGTELTADLVVMAVGIRPNFALAQATGIHCEKGIVVSDTLQTYDPRVYAVGECVQHRGLSYGLVAPLFEQAKVCANHLAELGYARYEGSITSTKLKITGIDLFSAGDFSGDDSTDEIVMQDAARGVYKKVVLDGNKIRGAVMYGDTLDGAWYFQMMRDGTDVSAFRERLLFGQAHLGDAGHGDIKQRINLMPDDAEICGCNGVCKGTIVKAIGEKKLFTLDEVRAHTKASSSCGSCTGLVEALLATTAGGDYSTATKKKPMCPCTDHSHDELRIAIRAQSLKTIPAVMQQLQWKTPNGCGKCRPALNFYLLTAWPGEYVDDNQSRFINERAHANIQKDGTYSVVPRIWGGETTPRELRSLAEIAEKYRVPTVHITGGQRIDFLGVKKETLPLIWGDLSQAGFVSGHAYGKAIRTVKTCVGSQWCRFGTQDSTTLGIQLEKMAWGAWTPHKFKLGVSGCPRNCAEATIKDFGVVCVDSGYELHVGGNGGVKVRVTDFLCRVKTPEEALEYCAAFLQLYREEAHYLERTAPWIERVGLAYVKQRVVENEAGRKELADRFHYSQKFSQDDPWAARAQGAERHEFIPLKMVG
ncbi:MAG: nitrite reductase large subunit [Candidatus Muproteobacteria bacterium RIFCSPHIGHO2_12_FULL_60_33]|uniref:Nitrite reductase large subunit n=1 Tax=Candidatus Muproteobacteria bacterium RIFCSPLOWO2_01_FULL_60_18 TaxID=1817768 RepID=A0A1F6TY94_9PROT|nr:MAG: nitrite reductase large subunit [Candidatus Muproteobacteria bacterium RIFCSPHIGHO2_01_60_12]OGI50108.1 MAG: nitrite reductase large subunit [Candidatus Muproteobacteria bacterium RIFCSPLOWO2_01_FULL_60_18]OGI55156.1 MAG: nitrite reductase large subunit [Candidatus Muproteobacteria bacterium RIFCSPHIGHO2_12_FULL_60_33]OGI56180.1 MAG: nitrite reductase large subunit [Candidatus Muproteobacteria bacterium RIFCSPHIGHO2_02_FULL_60_13]